MKTVTFEGKKYVLDYVSSAQHRFPPDPDALATLGTDILGKRSTAEWFRFSDVGAWNQGIYDIYKLADKRDHKYKPRKTALKRAGSIVTTATLTPSQLTKLIADIERQIRLAVKAAFQRKARKNDR